ncbi:MAG: hypothetical protein WCP21_10790 [Armatimonadota bacterium]
MITTRVRLARWRGWGVIAAAIAGYVVASLLSFFGSCLVAFALREILQPQVVAWIPLRTTDAHDFRIATFLSWMLTMLLVAPFVGLLSASVSRPLGKWRLLMPVVVLLVQATSNYSVAARLVRHPFPTEAARIGTMMALSGFHLLAIVTLLAIVPAVVGAWLGIKLWPTIQSTPATPAETCDHSEDPS